MPISIYLLVKAAFFLCTQPVFLFNASFPSFSPPLLTPIFLSLFSRQGAENEDTTHTGNSVAASPSVQPGDVKPQMKFRKQGEGILKILAPKEDGEQQVKADAESSVDKKARLIMRQKGTWSVLLNSPLWLSKKFQLVPQSISGFGVRFVALDNKDAGGTGTIRMSCISC